MDVATLQAGRWIENKLSERDDKGKPVWTIEKLIGEPGRKAQPAPGQFGSLKAMARTVRIKDDGTWDDE